MALRLLVVEGNARDARERHLATFGKTCSQSYADTLVSLAPDAICDICMPADEGANLPDTAGLESYDGVALTGSALNMYDGGPAIMRQLDLARAIFAARTPFFGSCWGLQIAATAAGGDVIKNPQGRGAGIARNITRTHAGTKHPLLAGRPCAFDAPCVHIDIVARPPADADILAFNAHAPVQAAEIRHAGGVFWGVQYHPEYALDELAAIIERRLQPFVAEGFFADEEQGRVFCADMRTLHADPTQKHISWRYGVPREITQRDLRLTELRNWLADYVRPEKSRRGRA
jgi:GMP synthase (glutamine-hydrolysing)